jgi:uncharacterized protein YbjT (DUF2867 family)
MILITGANGTVGSAVLKEIARSGVKHRASYRSPEDAAKVPAGTEAVVADFSKKETLKAAFQGVDQAYLVCSPIPQLVEYESNAIDACVAAGVKHVVLNSALGAGDFPKSFPSWHRKVEDMLTASGLSYTMLRPNSFSQNAVTYFAPSIRTQGAFYGALGNARISYIDVRDVAAAVVKTLPGGVHARKIYELNGPEAISLPELAAKITKHAGRPVQYVNLPIEELRKAMLDQRVPEWMVNAELELESYYLGGQGGSTDNVLRDLIGRAPITMDQFLAENAAAFRTQAASA